MDTTTRVVVDHNIANKSLQNDLDPEMNMLMLDDSLPSIYVTIVSPPPNLVLV